MRYKYEFYIGHSDGTWSDCNFVEVSEENVHDWDGNTDAMAMDLYKQENPNQDIVFMVVYSVEQLED